MFSPLSQAELDALYEQFGRADDELVRQVHAEFHPDPMKIELQAVMTSVPDVDAQDELAPLALIDTDHEYEKHGSYVVVKTRPGLKAVEVKGRLGLGQCISFYSTASHVPVGDQYIARAPTPADVRVPLPPSRRDKTVSGQLKLLIDVSLMLPYVRSTDRVWVIGSANTIGTKAAEVYQMLESCVSSITLVDPCQPEFMEQRGVTMVRGVGKVQQSEILCDVLFNDAANPQGTTVENVVLPFMAREFSLKCAGVTAHQQATLKKYRKMEKKFYAYVQLSDTFEMRLVSRPRYIQRYRQRLGTCSACVEIDYGLPYEFEFTARQYQVIRDIHAYGEGECSLKQYSRPQGQNIFNTLLMRDRKSVV